MSNSMLPKDQGVALLQKLATDDAFRSLFESDPSAALLEAGISADIISTLSKACSTPCKLAPKAEFSALLQDMGSEKFSAAMSMGTPQIRFE